MKALNALIHMVLVPSFQFDVLRSKAITLKDAD
jgi:hypothetical protein